MNRIEVYWGKAFESRIEAAVDKVAKYSHVIAANGVPAFGMNAGSESDNAAESEEYSVQDRRYEELMEGAITRV